MCIECGCGVEEEIQNEGSNNTERNVVTISSIKGQ